jgi:hypothetical protein
MIMHTDYGEHVDVFEDGGGKVTCVDLRETL